MHYNRMQPRPAEVGALAMSSEQRVADEVAKAGLRAKPGPNDRVEIADALQHATDPAKTTDLTKNVPLKVGRDGTNQLWVLELGLSPCGGR
jgi:hypothetical protein